MKTVIFDMDGVLVDTEPLNEAHMIMFLSRMGIEIDSSYLRKFRGTHARYTWDRITQEFKITTPLSELIPQARASYLDYLLSLKGIRPTEGVVSFLQELKINKVTLGIASSASSKRLNALLGICKLRDYFEVVLSGDDVTHSKPHPEVYLKTAKLLKKDPAICVVFEDATNGILAAKAAGMKVIGYRGKEHNTQDLSKADKVIGSFSEASYAMLEKI